ncbi:MAG: hypothetical protein AVDCRST_MAG05-4069, partial [uncultured Rubrobacteraceae bacterium]
ADHPERGAAGGGHRDSPQVRPPLRHLEDPRHLAVEAAGQGARGAQQDL